MNSSDLNEDLNENFSVMQSKNVLSNEECKELQISQNQVHDNSALEHETFELRRALSDTVYQLDILMWYLVKGIENKINFRLASVLEPYGKFDDLFFRYKTKNELNYQFQFLQVKHKPNPESYQDKITEKHLLSDGKIAPFAIMKYFISFLKIKNDFENNCPFYNGGSSFMNSAQYFILATNNDIDPEIKDAFEDLKEDEKINLLLPSEEVYDKKKYFRIKPETEFSDKLKEQLLDLSNFNRLAKLLALYVVMNAKIRPTDSFIKMYFIVLVKEKVIDWKHKKLHQDFISNNLNSNLQKFRIEFLKQLKLLLNARALKTDTQIELLNLLEANKDEETLQKIVIKTFARKEKIKNPVNLAKKLALLIKNAYLDLDTNINKCIFVNAQSDSFQFINALFEIVFIENNGKIQFAPNFLDLELERNQNIRFIKIFRTELRNCLSDTEWGNLSNFSFIIEDFPKTNFPSAEDKITDLEVESFLKKFVLVIRLPDREPLMNMIKNSMKQHLDKTNVDNYFYAFRNGMLNWLSQEKENFLSHEKMLEFFDKVKGNENALVVNYETFSFRKEMNTLGIKCKSINTNVITALREFIESEENVNVLNVITPTVLSFCLVYKTLKSILKDRTDNYIFSNLNHLLRRESELTTLFSSNSTYNILILHLNYDEIDILESFITSVKFDKKLIIFTNKVMNPGINFNLPIKKILYEQQFRFDQLTLTSKTKLVKDTYINFQGNIMKLIDILVPDETVSEFIHSYLPNIYLEYREEALNRLKIEMIILNDIIGKKMLAQIIEAKIKYKILEIGTKPLQVSDLEPAFYETLNNINIETIQDINEFKNILKCDKSKNDIFVFSKVEKDIVLELIPEGINLEEWNNKCVQWPKGRFVLIAGSEINNFKEFKKICQNYAQSNNKMIHFLEKKGQQFQWGYCDPNYYIPREFKLNLVKKEILNSSDKFVCAGGAMFFGENVYHTSDETEAEHKFKEWVNSDLLLIEIEIEKSSLILNGFKGNRQKHIDMLDVEYHSKNMKVDNVKVKEFLNNAKSGNFSNTDNFIFIGSEQNLRKILELENGEPFKANVYFIMDKAEAIEKFKKMKNSAVHWIRKNEENFIWYRSHHGLNTLYSYSDSVTEINYSEQEFLKKMALTSDQIIITAEPGMGKSTTLTNLANMTNIGNNRINPKWIIRIDLKIYKEAIMLLGNELNMKKIVQLLSFLNEQNLEKDLFQAVLMQSFQNNNNVILLLDGFDEIESVQQEQVITLIKYLKIKTKSKIWITTRETHREHLENNLSTLAYFFSKIPVTASKDKQETQISFLASFWEKSLRLKCLTNESDLRSVAATLLDIVDKNFRETNSLLIGIPLQLRLLAEVYAKDIKKYFLQEKTQDELNVIFKEINLINLYEKFVERKYEIYFQEKKANTAQFTDIHRQLFIESFTKYHRKAAIEILFLQHYEIEVKALLEEKLLTIDEKEKISHIGIVKFIGNKIDFIHHTFAEYFLADFVVYKLSKKNNSLIKEFLLRNIFKNKNQLIFRLIDLKTSQMKIDSISQSWDEIKKCCLIKYNNSDSSKSKFFITNEVLPRITLDDLEYHKEWIPRELYDYKCSLKFEMFITDCYLYETDADYLETVINALTEIALNTPDRLVKDTILYKAAVLLQHYSNITSSRCHRFTEDIIIKLKLKNYKKFVSKYHSYSYNDNEVRTEIEELIKNEYFEEVVLLYKKYPNMSVSNDHFDNVYQNKSFQWLETKGIRFAEELRKLTITMSECFKSFITNVENVNSYHKIYVENIWRKFLIHRLNEKESIEKNMEINKLAFVDMFFSFAKFSQNKKCLDLDLNYHQMKNLLNYIKCAAGNNYFIYSSKSIQIVIDSLLLLSTIWNLKIIRINDKLLIMDPVYDFRYELTLPYQDKLIKLIKSKQENTSDDYYIKFNEIKKEMVLKRLRHDNENRYLMGNKKRRRSEEFEVPPFF